MSMTRGCVRILQPQNIFERITKVFTRVIQVTPADAIVSRRGLSSGSANRSQLQNSGTLLSTIVLTMSIP